MLCRFLVNAVVGVRTLWQPQIGPAPVHLLRLIHRHGVRVARYFAPQIMVSFEDGVIAVDPGVVAS